MKKMVSAALAVTMLLGTNVFAADRNLTDAAKGIVKISGTTQSNGLVNILITNPGYTIDTAEQDGARQYVQSFKATEDGTYEHNIVLNMDNATSGYFKVYVKEGSADVVELNELYFASVGQKTTEMKKVLADTTLILSDSDVKNVFGLNESLYTSIDMNAVATKLNTYLTANPIEIADDDTDEIKLEKFSALSNKIKEIAVIEAYNESKGSVLFNSQYGFECDDVLNITTLDSDKGVTVYNLYTQSLTDNGRKFVQNAMLGKNVNSVDALQRIFAKSVMLSGITNHKDAGYGHISSYVTQKNVAFATGSTNGVTEADTYLQLTNKSNADYYIKSNSSSLTMDNFLNKIEYYAVNYGSTSAGGGSEGGSSSSGGSGGGVYITSPVIITDNNESRRDEQAEVEEKIENTASGTFKDVYDNFWGKDAIEYLYKKGVISGMDDDTFAPNDNLTREQAVKILCMAFEITDIKDLYSENGITYDYTDYTMFGDVTQYDWYGEYVFAAYRNNIVNGIADGVFGVGSNVTRQDIATMIYRIKNGTSANGELSFDDAGDVADYAKDAVAYMKAENIVSGYEDNTFRPNNFITRAEISQIVYNILSKEG